MSTAFRPQVKEAAGAPEAAYPVFVVRPSKAGRPWTPEEDALLGTMPNAEVARRTGRTLSAVEQRRSYLRHRGRKD